MYFYFPFKKNMNKKNKKKHIFFYNPHAYLAPVFNIEVLPVLEEEEEEEEKDDEEGK